MKAEVKGRGAAAALPETPPETPIAAAPVAAGPVSETPVADAVGLNPAVLAALNWKAVRRVIAVSLTVYRAQEEEAIGEDGTETRYVPAAAGVPHMIAGAEGEAPSLAIGTMVYLLHAFLPQDLPLAKEMLARWEAEIAALKLYNHVEEDGRIAVRVARETVPDS